MPYISKEWEIPAGLVASQNSSIINHEIIYQLQFMSNSREKLKNTCNYHNHASMGSETDSSNTITVVRL